MHYYRVCDKCGEITAASAGDDRAFVCKVCASEAAWEFPQYGKALDMQRQIQDRIAS